MNNLFAADRYFKTLDMQERKHDQQIIRRGETEVNYTRFIDIDSSFRNRVKYPYSSDYVIRPLTLSASSSIDDPVILAVPYVTDTIPDNTSTTTIVTLATGASSNNNAYNTSYLGVGGEFRQISSYTGASNSAILSSALTLAPSSGDTYTIRKELPIASGAIGAGSTNYVANLNVGASNNEADHVNRYLYMINGVNAGQAKLITYYDTSGTKLATLSTPFTSPPNPGDLYEIAFFSNDNSHGFNVNLTYGHQVYKTIQMLYLSIPNLTLANGNGGVLRDYPYLYIVLYNENNGVIDGSIISNNPGISRSLFKVPVPCYHDDDTFIHCRDSKMQQRTTLNLDQALHFSVLLPNGTPIRFAIEDNLSPLEPNPNLQISATFSVQ